jgi:hypothetical protein
MEQIPPSAKMPPTAAELAEFVPDDKRKGVEMTERTRFTVEEAQKVGETIGIDWSSAPFDVEQFRIGMDVELEHGLHDLQTNVTDSDPIVTGRIALAHLKEFPDYYTRLALMEADAEREQ